MSKEVEEAINYFEDREISMKVDVDTDKLLKALGITEEDSFDKQVYSMKTLINRIKELEKERDGIYADYQDLGKAYYDSIPKQVIRDKILYYKSFGIHKVNNGLIGENFSEWTEYVMQDEIDILNELLESEE